MLHQGMIEGESSIHQWQKIFDYVILMIYVNHTSTVFLHPSTLQSIGV